MANVMVLVEGQPISLDIYAFSPQTTATRFSSLLCLCIPTNG